MASHNESHHELTVAEASLPAGSAWRSAWKVTAALALLGGIGAAIGANADHERFAFSYLFAFLIAFTLVMGSFFFILIQYLTSAGWSVVIRRFAEFFASVSPLLLLLFIPVAMNLKTLYPWLHAGEHHAESAEHHEVTPEHGSPHDHDMAAQPQDDIVAAEQAQIEHHEHTEIVQKKAGYLNLSFLFIRAGIYFLVWSLLGFFLFRWSTAQDTTRDPLYTRKINRIAPVAIISFAFTLTFAAFDWIMSLEPSWYSTIFGVYIFAGSVVSFFAVLIIMSFLLRKSGILTKVISVEHFHDLGKLQFGFLIFWAYISFSQFMLIWYASIPEETTFYHRRWTLGWKEVSLSLVFVHFIIPFFLILSRNIKRRVSVLVCGSFVILSMHVVEMYWLVLPYAGEGILHVQWIDLACAFAVVGTLLTGVLFRMTRHPLVPVGDPRLPRSLAFENA